MKLPKVAFLIPAYGSVKIPAYDSMINFVANTERFCQAAFIVKSSCYVHENRNRLVKAFLEADEKLDFDYAFWIDSDMVFTWQHVKQLLKFMEEKNVDIATGVYYSFVQGGKPGPVIVRKKEDDSWETMPASELKEPMIVDGAGFGFVVMKTKILKEMAQKKGEHVFGFRFSKKGKMIGEDNLFFEEAKQLGYGLWVVPQVRVGHAKTVVV
ncbi:MAG: glycosyltransferase [Candidatus Diapherotrites archaeon]|nr:glycosyltransferase [Candidatus Diapherotrites archaeon]